MELLDPTTGQPLPEDAIQRVLFIAPAAHVYNIPPLQSTKGHMASTWTTPASRHIFTARLRIIETDTSSDDNNSSSLKVDIVLEDPSTGQLFAAAPYTDPKAVEPVVDSSRFFAVMVRDPEGRRAMLGVGFEERSDAFDFGVALQEARKGLGLEGHGAGDARGGKKEEPKKEETKDYSLKEGETITVNLGGKGRRRPQAETTDSSSGGDLQSFALAPPPSAGSSGGFALPPPPQVTDVKTKRRSIRDMGFDDGQFGEFA
ncbi:DUF1681-domain-containing protein [Sarocladium strictum]